MGKMEDWLNTRWFLHIRNTILFLKMMMYISITWHGEGGHEILLRKTVDFQNCLKRIILFFKSVYT